MQSREFILQISRMLFGSGMFPHTHTHTYPWSWRRGSPPCDAHTHTHTVVIRPYLGEGNSCVPPKFSSLSASLGDIQDFSHTHTHTHAGAFVIGAEWRKEVSSNRSCSPRCSTLVILALLQLSHAVAYMHTHVGTGSEHPHQSQLSLTHTHTLTDWYALI